MRRVLIGGVGYRWRRDGSLGLIAADALAASALPEGVEAADLGYGAILVAQDLADAKPPYSSLVLVTARQRGRAPGTIERYAWDGRLPDAEHLQDLVREAGAGVVDVEHLLAVAGQFGGLPSEVTVIDVEPFDVSPGEELSERGRALLPDLLGAAHAAAMPANEAVL